MGLKHHLCFAWVIVAIALVSCSTQSTPQKQRTIRERETSLREVTLDETKVVMGQTV
ncbi:hypothetical protein H6F88_15925 [Oculatella sp. FACHB-28]|uniref:hypothetical protein n=1 Tax=Oculatella sp. FACHB-28 TaxID=2692845 RepID=UPI001683EE4E|nr:hypothetical protein [Oculatella sp. FACHB-28]MBD2057492.1 hypothetical protein [Oculatella sp. FACHB-28]